MHTNIQIQWQHFIADFEQAINRITPQIAGNLWTFLKSLMKEQICQSRSLFQFQHGGRFALRKKCYRENEEQIEVLMRERATGNLDTAHFLDAIYRRIGD